ncbi:hypothetical protein JRQ81_010587 [Phrynocephalus forsythii]|uniref:Interferon/interleukin receptor domain-containing protein n=1 Tax=Phrynocephalus forsythii TaxID=171643 RepID=A0A9Q0X8X5_9SAUR|nr:hypothetical protein JRQ81_010587 [Phrynocephalus forsythii]
MPPNNSQWIYIGNSLDFEIPSLQWGERYCVQVKLQVASWPLQAVPTEEQCISTPALQEEEEHAVATPHLSLLGLVALGALAFGIGLAWAYVKKPRKTPVMLTSLLDRHSHERPRNENLPRLSGIKEVVLRLERDPIHPLYSLHLEDLHLHTGSDGHEGMEVLPTPLEKGCWLPGWAAEGSGLKRTILDTSRGSIDSGVCLQDPTDHLGLFLGSRKLSLGSHKRSSSFQGDPGGLWLEEQLLPVVPIVEERLLLQSWPSRSQGQPREALEGEGCSTLSSGLGGAACSVVGLATGYLKQASLEPPSARGMAAPARDFTDTTNSCASPPA